MTPYNGKKENDRGGFTLIETILTLSIMVLVLGILFAAFRLGIRSWERGESSVERSSVKRFLASRLASDISSIYPYMISDGINKSYLFSGLSDHLGLVSVRKMDVTGQPWGGALWINYSVGPEGLKLNEKTITAQNVAGEGGGKEILLEPDVKEIRFEYQQDESWAESWDADDKKGLPTAIRATITFKEASLPFKITIPVNIPQPNQSGMGIKTNG
ncbi:MAG: prepilin-type N-terminal cleavage/methylation domain-containing protein [Nitrospiria bacterium]